MTPQPPTTDESADTPEEQPPERYPTIGELIGLDKEDTPYGEVFRKYLRLDIRTEGQLLKLGPADRYLWLVYCFYEAVQNGGIDGFFWNESAEFLPETLGALDAIGASRTCRTLRRVCDLFPDRVPAKDHQTRQEQIRNIMAASGKAGDVYLEDLVECDEDPNLFELLLEYRKRQ